MTCPHGVKVTGDLTPEQAVRAINMTCHGCNLNAAPVTRMDFGPSYDVVVLRSGSFLAKVDVPDTGGAL